MTHAAREVLADCHIALGFLEAETELPRWRVHWAGAVALTRAAGHVLDKVDGRDPRVAKATKAAYRLWKSGEEEHEISREFVERERNSILKTYRFSHHPLDEVEILVTADHLNQATGEIHRSAEVVPIRDNVYRPVLDGYRAGDDARDVLADALKWWAVQLDAIDLAVAAGPRGG